MSTTGTEATATQAGAIVGVDLSKWQGEVDFAKIRAAGKRYVFVKVTQGATGIDPDYTRNIAGARAAGLYTGSYHFYTTDHDAQSQFANLSQHLDLRPGDLPPVIDIEVLASNSLPDLATQLKTFLDLIANRYVVKPILYSGLSFANAHLQGLGAYPLWIAEYNDAPAPKLPSGWTDWTFWQHSQSGSVDGVSGAVDLDRFNGDEAKLRALLVV
jgi:lysozyme